MKAAELERIRARAGSMPRHAHWLLDFLAARARPDGTGSRAWTSEEIGRYLSVSSRVVERAKKVLVQRGVIDAVKEGNNGVRYRIHVPQLVDADDVALPYEGAE